jgi:hypothetical protein
MVGIFSLDKVTSKALWVGRVLSGLVIVFLLMDASMKLLAVDAVLQASTDLGFESTVNLARGLGLLLLICTLLYAFPKTNLLGAVLLTGYLGGAIAIHLRLQSPLFSHLFFGGYLGIMLWIGLLLRKPQLRILFWN